MKMENYERLNYLCDSTESTRILADIDGHDGTTENDVQSHKKKKTKTFKIVESVFLTCLFVSWVSNNNYIGYAYIRMCGVKKGKYIVPTAVFIA